MSKIHLDNFVASISQFEKESIISINYLFISYLNSIKEKENYSIFNNYYHIFIKQLMESLSFDYKYQIIQFPITYSTFDDREKCELFIQYNFFEFACLLIEQNRPQFNDLIPYILQHCFEIGEISEYKKMREIFNKFIS